MGFHDINNTGYFKPSLFLFVSSKYNSILFLLLKSTQMYLGVPLEDFDQYMYQKDTASK